MNCQRDGVMTLMICLMNCQSDGVMIVDDVFVNTPMNGFGFVLDEKYGFIDSAELSASYERDVMFFPQHVGGAQRCLLDGGESEIGWLLLP